MQFPALVQDFHGGQVWKVEVVRATFQTWPYAPLNRKAASLTLIEDREDVP
jgi:hypothetical protein